MIGVYPARETEVDKTDWIMVGAKIPPALHERIRIHKALTNESISHLLRRSLEQTLDQSEIQYSKEVQV